MLVGCSCVPEQGDAHFRWVDLQSFQDVVSARLDGPCRCGAVAPRTGPGLVCFAEARRCLACGRSGHRWALKVPGHRELPMIVCPDCWAEIS
jgi:hypothetical protein